MLVLLSLLVFSKAGIGKIASDQLLLLLQPSLKLLLLRSSPLFCLALNALNFIVGQSILLKQHCLCLLHNSSFTVLMSRLHALKLVL